MVLKYALSVRNYQIIHKTRNIKVDQVMANNEFNYVYKARRILRNSTCLQLLQIGWDISDLVFTQAVVQNCLQFVYGMSPI